ncbi:hypothetical protein [Desulfitobacterium sp. PCE1]|uniref:hypothetical protein n=1 Tax=Desulfitobacterium sp. PCE1 TaxID=146907 RepID=UPI0003703C43|nr:hypothetical protein [Desulfitobacterium sp. PCE1]
MNKKQYAEGLKAEIAKLQASFVEYSWAHWVPVYCEENRFAEDKGAIKFNKEVMPAYRGNYGSTGMHVGKKWLGGRQIYDDHFYAGDGTSQEWPVVKEGVIR